MDITNEQLAAIMTNARKTGIDVFAPLLRKYMEQYEINTPIRISMFLSQIAHESGELRYTREIWGPTDAQRRYEKRIDLGNLHVGDGKKFMGRGLIQITGRANYAACSLALTGSPDTFLDNPELLSTPKYATESACWFWYDRGLNELADSEDFQRITKRINGGLNGLESRIKFFERAKKNLAV
jgi:putative chitinase|uniref:PWe2 endolysin n=1 Tax=metagenome TaxID=256318 RepID=UPI003D18FD06